MASNKNTKALYGKAHTSDTRTVSQEPLSRSSTATPRNTRSLEPTAGMELGSWFASASRRNLAQAIQNRSGTAQRLPAAGGTADPANYENLLGRLGLPEITYTPYRKGTNANRIMSPSLLGDFVSFEVVGPTLKSKSTHWAWSITDSSGFPGTPDSLTLATGAQGVAAPASIAAVYGSLATLPEGGLYVALVDLEVNVLGTVVSPKKEHIFTATSELFKVQSVTGSTIELDPEKRIADYFTSPNGKEVGGLVLIKPVSARAAAFPGSGPRGQEKTFAILPPQYAATGDLYPSLSDWTGVSSDWQGNIKIPIMGRQAEIGVEKISGSFAGTLGKYLGAAPDVLESQGLWRLESVGVLAAGSPPYTPVASDVGKIIHIHNLDIGESATIEVVDGSGAATSSAQHLTGGFFEIKEAVAADPDYGTYFILKRIPVANPSTGQIFSGSGPYNSDASTDVEVHFTVFNSVESIWTGLAPDIDLIEGARVTNLIRPPEEQRTITGVLISGTSLKWGSSAQRPGKAAFDARSSSVDAGNLRNLGFEITMFPAKVGLSGALVPDFDKPFYEGDLIIDPGSSEQQSIEIDYAAGLIHLSHEPPSAFSAQSAIKPNDLSAATNNPRGEAVIFASFIQYSDQAKGIRVTAGDPAVGVSAAQAGVYGRQEMFSVLANHSTLTEGGLLLTDANVTGLPERGSLFLFDDANDPYGDSFSKTQYNGVERGYLFGGVTPTTRLLNISIDQVIGAGGGVLKLQSDSLLRLDPAFDFSYGFAASSDRIAFDSGTLKYNDDGSITISPHLSGGIAQELRAFTPYGSSSEVARLHFDPAQGTWSAGTSPVQSSPAEVGIDIGRGRLFTSVNFDFNAGDFEFRRFINRAKLVTPESNDPGNYDSPGRFTIDISVGADPDIPDAALPFIPQSEIDAASQSLCAIVEGVTLASAEPSQWNGGAGSIPTGERIVIGLKMHTRRDLDGSAGNYTAELNKLDEGPSNPVFWVAVDAPVSINPATDLGNIAAAINTQVQTHLQDIEIAEVDTGNNRLHLTGRQLMIAPSKFYLESNPIGSGIVPPNSTLVLTLYSADPNQADKWVTVKVLVNPGVSINYSSAADLAHIFNQALYGRNILSAFDQAGFFMTDNGVEASPNAFVSTLAGGLGEIPIVFTASSGLSADPRHPAAADRVCLICGGWGSSKLGGDRDFFNVMLEVGRTDIWRHSQGAADASNVLGGDFEVLQEVPRAGLFFSSVGGSTNINAPGIADFSTEAVLATGNTSLGFSRFGIEPIGMYLGSFPIESTSTINATTERLTLRLPTGFEPGDQAGSSLSSRFTYGAMDREPHKKPSGILYNALQKGRSSLNSESSLDLSVHPYLGRWVWSVFQRASIDLSLAASAGIEHVWVGYGTKSHDERGFTSPLRYQGNDHKGGYENFLIYASSSSTSVSAPRLVSSNLHVGDIVLGSTSPAVASDAWEAVLYNTLAPSITPSSPDLAITALVRRGGLLPSSAEDLDSYTRANGPHPQSFGRPGIGPISVVNNFAVSILPNPSMSASAAVKFAQSALYGPSSEGSSARQGEGLDGGSANSSDLAQNNATLLSGGRINLISMAGPNAPSGIGFSMPVLGSGATSDSRFSSTFIEYGVFTTSLNPRQNSLGKAALGSAGFFDANVSATEGAPEGAGTQHARIPHGRYSGEMIGGAAGLRISGDAQIWLTGLRQLASTGARAVVLPVLRPSSSPLGTTATGFSTQVSDTHMGGQGDVFGPARRRESGSGRPDYQLQEATILLGLTQADLRAFMIATGQHDFTSSDPLSEDSVTHASTIFDKLSSISSSISDAPTPAPCLTGTFLKLENGSGSVHAESEGTWKVIATPQVTLSDAGLGGLLAGAISGKIGNKHSPFSIVNAPTPNADFTIRKDPGSLRKSAVIAVMMVRVERFGLVPSYDTDTFAPSPAYPAFYPANGIGFSDGYQWSFFEDQGATRPIYVAEVVTPGGSPSGVPSSVGGLTLDPASLGSNVSTLPMELLTIFSDTHKTDRWPLTGKARLYGIFETASSRGQRVSLAYFTMETPGVIATLPRNAYARAVIYSSQREDRVDEFSAAHTKGEFAIDSAGRVTFVGHTPRLGTGIILDGGLGMVQATSFRASPQSEVESSIGALLVYGQGGHPLPNFNSSKAKRGISLPSSFNEIEVYDALTVVTPRGALVFEDGHASKGLLYNLHRNIASADSAFQPRGTVALRTDYVGRPNLEDVFHRTIYPNDTLFPFPSAGVKFKGPGAIVYERSFRPADATGQSLTATAFTGRHSKSGIKGLEIPIEGECLLLPKGPPTGFGVGKAQFGSVAKGTTPLDLPLYEFTNGYGYQRFSGQFGINPTPIFTGAHNVAFDASTVNERYHSDMAVSYRHSNSAHGVNSEQIRLLEGMILEDIDNGTFYTVGGVGRWASYLTDGAPNPTHVVREGLGQIGNSAFRGITASVTCVHAGFSPLSIVFTYSGAAGAETFTVTTPSGSSTVLNEGVDFTSAPTLATAITGVYSGWPFLVPTVSQAASTIKIRYDHAAAQLPSTGQAGKMFDHSASFGSFNDSVSAIRVYNSALTTNEKRRAAQEAEVFYDIPSTTDVRKNLYADNQALGDMVRPDPAAVNGVGLRPLKGHRFRVTANVEFVPVLGPRGIQGGLLPPPSSHPDADAIFHTSEYGFKHPDVDLGGNDIGKMIYVCGTHEYRYTGWWMILDVIKAHATVPIDDTFTQSLRDVAVVRKLNRGNQVVPPDFDPSQVRGGLPLAPRRPPVLRMTADYATNDADWYSGLFNGNTPTGYSDLVIEVTDSAGVVILQETVTTAGLLGGGVFSAATLATFCNSDIRTNGDNANFGGLNPSPAGWITWTSEVSPNFPGGVTVEVSYDLRTVSEGGVLTAAQVAKVAGGFATLRVHFLSNLGVSGVPGEVNHNVAPDHIRAIGFTDATGAGAQSDNTIGDRNSQGEHFIPGSLLPNVGGAYAGKSAAVGLRWVFSVPLKEEHTGSFLQIHKAPQYFFGESLASQGTNLSSIDATSWLSGNPELGDQQGGNDLGLKSEIYRINRCPNTSHLVVGGDCEIYVPEIIETAQKNAPIVYSPLGVGGRWTNTDGSGLFDALSGSATSLGTVIRYKIHPIARERIVTISPGSMRSTSILGRSSSAGVGGHVSVDSATLAISGETPWKLLDRYSVVRTRASESHPDFGAGFNQSAEINNANNPTPGGLATATDLSPSVYTWAPAGEWWQMVLPEYVSTQYDASHPVPTLKVDLTEAFTQSMQPGGGVNSPYFGHQPKGLRLTKIWANVGVWGDAFRGYTPGAISPNLMPGYPDNALSDNQEALHHFYMAFNLIVELPGSQSFNDNSATGFARHSGTASFPFGDRFPNSVVVDESVADKPSQGVFSIPLYCNRGAGDLMPNVMERNLSVGPHSLDLAAADWSIGDPEYGAGAVAWPYSAWDGAVSELENGLRFNGHAPVLWSGMDFSAGLGGQEYARPFTRQSAWGGKDGLVTDAISKPDGGYFLSTGILGSLSNPTISGLVLAHSSIKASAPKPTAGTYQGAGTPTVDEGVKTCPHAFTIGLTPLLPESRIDSEGEDGVGIGNWLSMILLKNGYANHDGAMLPPGARVYLEISAGPGWVGGGLDANPANNYWASGTWVGSVKCSFDVETPEGLAYTTDTALLGHEGS